MFTALVLIFQLVNSKKILDDQAKRLIKLKSDKESYEDSVLKLQSQLDEVNDFTLVGNEYALEYFKNTNIDNIVNQIKDQLYEKNLLKDKNDLIPYKTMNRNFLINKIRVLNHKWLIADFSDGTNWGELFVAFRIDQSGKINFKLKEHFLYTTPE